MEAKELRIGNIVRYTKNVYIHGGKTTGITEIIPHETDTYVGIELTEEWLLKFGFRVGKTEEYYELEFIEMFGYDNGDWNFRYLGNLIKLNLKHVHQLQNLFYALCGTELTIKE